MFKLDGISVAHDGVLAVDDVSLDLPEGQVLAVLGPSGCGKSTLLRIVAGLEPLTTGQVLVEGRDQARVPTHKRGFALMFQDGQLFNQQTVAGNIGYPQRIRRQPRRQIDARVAELLATVGLEGYADRRPDTLSGGERQRVALARALAVSPRLLLLDEPLSALDASLRERLAADLRRVITDTGTTALLVTHDHEEAFAVADAMALMRAGRVVQSGAPSEVWAAPVDAEAALFLGYDRVLAGAAAQTVLTAAGTPDAGAVVALRRSALELVPDGDAHATLRGVVLTARAAPEVVRLTVEVAGIGELAAVAPPRELLPGPGQEVRLRVVRDRLAIVGNGKDLQANL